jgi:phosphoribosyl-ATP pyrophosphohydrolase/phosphoribosyl-AMP cyclohydrolase
MMETIDWKKYDGLVTAVVQDPNTRTVLMVGSMNQAALQTTIDTGRVTFFSRSKKRLWTKGETSGNFLGFISVAVDCDGDALLITAKPYGPTCHQNTTSCFGEVAAASGVLFLSELEALVADRYQLRPAESYTTQLFNEGLDRVIQKVGEEAIEVVIAAKNESSDLIRQESADLLFHLLVLWREKNISVDSIVDILRRRNTKADPK